MTRIPVSGPWITDKEVDYVTDAARNAWYANHAMYHERFETAFAQYCGTKYAISLPSCTSAIHLALAARGIGQGDEVIVPDATWIASAAPITYVGATTVFADIEAESWCMSPQSLEACITDRTKAVVVVDLYGCMPRMEELRAITRRHGLLLIEDAAEAVGAEYDGRKAGSIGDVGVFSFHGSKVLTTGEGGMLVTDDDAIYERAMFLRDHGRQPGDRYFFNLEVAYKYKMSAMQAALGLAQTERLDELVARKQQIFRWYAERFRDVEGVELNPELPRAKNLYWMVTVLLDGTLGVDKRALMAAMDERDIDTRPFFHPLSSIPAYEQSAEGARARERNRVAYEICPHGLNLPSGFNMTESLIDRVVDAVVETISGR